MCIYIAPSGPPCQIEAKGRAYGYWTAPKIVEEVWRRRETGIEHSSSTKLRLSVDRELWRANRSSLAGERRLVEAPGVARDI